MRFVMLGIYLHACMVAQCMDMPIFRSRVRKRAGFEFREWCRTHSSVAARTWTSRSLGLTASDSVPSFGSRFKAAYIRSLIPWVALEAVDQAVKIPSRYANVRCAAVHGLADLLGRLDAAGLVLTEDEAAACYAAGRLHLLSYQYMTFHGAPLYRTRPKWHYFDHGLEYMFASRENMRFFHNFRGEDFLGKICRIAGKVHRSNFMMRTLERWTLTVAERFDACK